MESSLYLTSVLHTRKDSASVNLSDTTHIIYKVKVCAFPKLSFDCDVHPAEAECEGCVSYVSESAIGKNRLEFVRSREMQDRCRKIAVGRLVAADLSSDPRHHLEKIKLVKGKEHFVLWNGKFQNDKFAPRFQNPSHLA